MIKEKLPNLNKTIEPGSNHPLNTFLPKNGSSDIKIVRENDDSELQSMILSHQKITITSRNKLDPLHKTYKDQSDYSDPYHIFST